MSKILLIAEHDGAALNPSTSKTVQCAQTLNPDSIDVVIFGDSTESVAGQAAKLHGITRVLTCERSEFAHPVAAQLAPQVAAIVTKNAYSHVFGPGVPYRSPESTVAWVERACDEGTRNLRLFAGRLPDERHPACRLPAGIRRRPLHHTESMGVPSHFRTL